MSVYVVFTVGVLVTAVGGWWLAGRLVDRDSPAGEVGRRVRVVADTAVAQLRPLGGYAAVVLAGLGGVLAVMWVTGELLAATEPAVDVPVFDWAQQRHTGNWWDHVVAVLTQMGNRPETELVVVVGSVLLAVLWRRRHPWIPPLVILTTWASERFVQKALSLVVDRGHPPTTMGTYPSGGCARLITVWGIVVLLVCLTWSVPRVLRVLAWTALAVLAFVEGYARTFRLEHWFTDVVGGWLYGALVLVVLATATTALCRGVRPQGDRSG